jgi:hypothetical protein
VLLGTPLGNILGTHWELEGNKGKMKKNPPLSPHTQNFFEKTKSRYFECMLSLSHWLHEISISKTVGHQFWPGPRFRV